MKKFEIFYLEHNAEYDGENMPSVIIEANDRVEAIRKFRKTLGLKNISVLDYINDIEIEEVKK